jgi:hypothetical protein
MRMGFSSGRASTISPAAAGQRQPRRSAPRIAATRAGDRAAPSATLQPARSRFDTNVDLMRALIRQVRLGELVQCERRREHGAPHARSSVPTRKRKHIPWWQAESKTLPVLQDLLLPWVMGDPAPLQGTAAATALLSAASLHHPPPNTKPTPPRRTPKPGTVDPQELADPDSRFLNVDGVELHFKDHLYLPEHFASDTLNPRSAASTAAAAAAAAGGPPAAGGEPLVVVLLHGFNGSTFSFRDTKPGVGEALARAG